MDTNRLNELKQLVSKKQAEMSDSRFSMWCASSVEFGEYCDLKKQLAREQQQAHKNDWKNDPASDKQISYLKSLGVKITGKQITKSLASQLIDAVKSGDGVGFLGFEMADGSN